MKTVRLHIFQEAHPVMYKQYRVHVGCMVFKTFEDAFLYLSGKFSLASLQKSIISVTFDEVWELWDWTFGDMDESGQEATKREALQAAYEYYRENHHLDLHYIDDNYGRNGEILQLWLLQGHLKSTSLPNMKVYRPQWLVRHVSHLLNIVDE